MVRIHLHSQIQCHVQNIEIISQIGVTATPLFISRYPVEVAPGLITGIIKLVSYRLIEALRQ